MKIWFKKFYAFLQFIMGKNQLIGGCKSIAEVKDWLETHGIERSTAAQVMGFLTPYGIALPAIQLCNHGLTYGFKDFVEWFYTKPDNSMPKENTLCIMWSDKNEDAIVGVLTNITKRKDGGYIFESNAGFSFTRCMRFDTMSQYRYLLNVPNDMEVELPQLAWEVEYKKIPKVDFCTPVAPKKIKKNPTEYDKDAN